MEQKKCKTCGRELPVSEFSSCALTKDRLQPSCKECMVAAIKNGRAKKIAPSDLAPQLSLSSATDEELFNELRSRNCEGEFFKRIKL